MAKLKDTEINGNLVVNGNLLNSDGVNLAEAFSNPNLFLNPNFAIWQRGNSVTVADSRTYTADRWGVYFKSTVSRNVDGAGMKIVAEAGDYGSVNQYVEFSYETIGLLINKPMTLTVRLKTSRPMNAGIGLVGNNKAITTTTDWRTYTFTFTPKDTDFTYISSSRTYFLRVNIFACDYINAYQDGDIIEISWAKLEYGSIATPFVPRPYAEELMICKRYYQAIQVSLIQIYQYNTKEFLFKGFYIPMRSVTPSVSYISLATYSSVTNVVMMATSTSVSSISGTDGSIAIRGTFPDTLRTGTYGGWATVNIDAEIY